MGKKSKGGDVYKARTFVQTEVKAGPSETFAFMRDQLTDVARENEVTLTETWSTTFRMYQCMFKAWNTELRAYWLDSVVTNLGYELWNAVYLKYKGDRKAENRADVVYQQFMAQLK